MLKQFNIGGEEWFWNTDNLRWSKTRLFKKEEKKMEQAKEDIPYIPAINISDWKSWKEFLYRTYKTSRLKPGWTALRDFHDIEDNRYFDFLEEQYEQGLIKPEPFR